MAVAELIKDLRDLIGLPVEYQGIRCEVIEVLEDKPSLVLQDCDNHNTIQADQHGEAHRRVPVTRTVQVPVYDSGHYDLAEVGIEILTEEDI